MHFHCCHAIIFNHDASLKLSELMAALSHALDITEGQPPGHCVRCCWIGMHIGREIGLPDDQLWELYYTLLLHRSQKLRQRFHYVYSFPFKGKEREDSPSLKFSTAAVIRAA